MYTLDTRTKKIPLTWLGITLFTIIFAAVYEHFSFGVYSGFMIFMFAFPLLLGFLPSLIISLKGWAPLSGFWNDGVIAMTAGSLLNGILEIYGTDSPYTFWLFILGAVLMIAGLLKTAFRSR